MDPKPPSRPTLDGLERKWADRWARSGVYRFDRTRPRSEVFSIDTPPPTVGGPLHLGHALLYLQADMIARFQRMRGRTVFFPMGWDDAGLPTERRVQRHFGVRCDPSLPYRPAFEPPEWPSRQPIAVSRPNFVELCSQLAMEDEQALEKLFRRLGLSVDWRLTYATIGEWARRTSQRAFLRLLAKGLAYQAEAPTLWEVDLRTALSHIELEDRQVEALSYRVRFAAGNDDVQADTTRPELLPACVALVVHPDDDRFRALVGRTVHTPIFKATVPVLSHRLADPDKGTGIAMVCTFGDPTDLRLWRDLGLSARSVLDRDGTIRAVRWGADGFETDAPEAAQRAYDQLAGLDVVQARDRMAVILRQAGALTAPPVKVVQTVRFGERGTRPVEIINSRQWFIRTLDLTPALQAAGADLSWHPMAMRSRFQAWVEGLPSDWMVSRQRFFGVPFPLWFPVAADGTADHDTVLVPDEVRLPLDPSTEVPAGYTPDQRGQPGGFVGASDVMDTRATSALSSEIAAGWEEDNDLFTRVFPMDLRPQGYDGFRPWLFYALAHAYVEHGSPPWAHTVIAGWVPDPARRRSAGSPRQVQNPDDALARFGADALRWWAAGRRAAARAAFDEGQLRVGRRVATKLLHAARFVLSVPADHPAVPEAAGAPVGGREPDIGEPLDQAMLATLAEMVAEATLAFEHHDCARALSAIDSFFWTFCNDYLELAKGRAYGEAGRYGQRSAVAALRLALRTLLALLAPVMPFVTEEVWSWWRAGSVHASPWPEAGPLRAATGSPKPSPLVLESAAAVLADVRRAKTLAGRSLRTEASRVAVSDRPERLVALAEVTDDLRRAGRITDLSIGPAADVRAVRVDLADA